MKLWVFIFIQQSLFLFTFWAYWNCLDELKLMKSKRGNPVEGPEAVIMWTIIMEAPVTSTKCKV